MEWWARLRGLLIQTNIFNQALAAGPQPDPAGPGWEPNCSPRAPAASAPGGGCGDGCLPSSWSEPPALSRRLQPTPVRLLGMFQDPTAASVKGQIRPR